MIDHLFEFFRKLVEDPGQSSGDSDASILAAVALMLEIARSDQGKDHLEIEVIRSIMTRDLGVAADVAEALILAGSEKVESATDLFQFTQLINEHFSHAQKENLVYALWRVALADGKIQAIEDHLIRRITGLIHIAHEDFIRLKLKARTDHQPG